MAQNPRRKKKSNIVPIGNVTYAVLSEPALGVVQMLEELLARAKKGEIIGAAVAFVEGGNLINRDWDCGRSGNHSMVAAIQALSYKFLKDWQEQEF